VAGAGWARRVAGILVPLLWPSIPIGWAMAFSFARAIQQPALEISQVEQAHVLAAR
jgi:hypothetical protein